MHLAEAIMLIAADISFFIVLTLAVYALIKDYTEQRKLCVVIYFYASLLFSVFIISKIFNITSSYIEIYRIAPVIVLLGFILVLLLFILNIPYATFFYFYFAIGLIAFSLFNNFFKIPLFRLFFYTLSLVVFLSYIYLYIKTKNRKLLLLLIALIFYALGGFSTELISKSIFYIAANFSVFNAINHKYLKAK